MNLNAWISEGVRFGLGRVSCHGVSINYGTLIKNFVVMNMKCAIAHNVSTGNQVVLAPKANVGGHILGGKDVEVRVGSATKQLVSINSRL